MKLKKLFCLLLALLMVLALAACSEGGFDKALDGTVNGGQDSGDGQDGQDGGTGADLTSFSDGFDENGFFKGIRALDLVTLPAFSDVELPVFDKVTSDRVIADGDFVNIDYVGSIDGVEFDGGSTQGRGSDIVVGYTSFIDDFIEQLIGHAPGERFDIEVTFPENYGEETLAGKDAVFNITVNYIWDFTDEAASALGFAGRDGMGQYVAYNMASVEDLVSDPGTAVYLTACDCSEVPQSVLDTMTDLLTRMIQLQASQYGLDADTFVLYIYGAPSLQEYLEVEAASEAEICLILQAVAERDGITASAEDIVEQQLEGYVDTYGMPYMLNTILQQKVMEHLQESMA